MDATKGASRVHAPGRARRPILAAAVAVVVMFGMFAGAVSPASADRGKDRDNMTLTLVRHGESFGNTSGFIDTRTPGPNITPAGWGQALAVTEKLVGNKHDAIYASTMIRTQQTATPLATQVGMPIKVLPGLREVEAGDLEGAPNAQAGGYLGVVMNWVAGDRSARITGGMNGDEFDRRADGAVQKIYNDRSRNPVAFSHGAAMMAWVNLNVKNPVAPDFAQQHIPNTVVVVICGNPRNGWTLVSWDGIEFAPACPRRAA